MNYDVDLKNLQYAGRFENVRTEFLKTVLIKKWKAAVQDAFIPKLGF